MGLTIKSVPKSIVFIESYLKDLFEVHGLEDDLYDDMMISLTEAVNNAIIHGNHMDDTKEVGIQSIVDEKCIRLIISDQGHGFDPQNLSDPCDDCNLQIEGGRGVMIMKALSSQVRFHNGGATVELVFTRR